METLISAYDKIREKADYVNVMVSQVYKNFIEKLI